MGRLADIVWPALDGWTPSERAEQNKCRLDDIQSIEASAWERHIDLALNQTKLLLESEEQRKSTVDSKASTYLVVVATITPILTYLETSVWDKKVGTAPRGVSLIVVAVASVYLVRAGFWAFTTLRVGRFCRLGADDFLRIWSKDEDPRAALIRESLVGARLNQDTINEKVDAFRLAHAFLLRALFCFGALIVIEAVWELATLVATYWGQLRGTEILVIATHKPYF